MSTEVVHRLGVAMGIAVALGWVVRSLDTVRRRRRVRQRLAEVLVRPARTEISRLRAREVLRRWLPEVAVVCAGLTVGGEGVGLGLGLAGVAVLWWWRRRQQATDSMSEAEARAAARQLPLAADLLAACIAAGAGPVIAAQAVGEALDGPVGKALARGAAEVRLGGEPSDAWRMLASAPGADALARLLERADVSGLPAAVPVARIAADARADWARAGTARARRAAVLVAAPVGLCFLPAFIAVGIVPVVIGLAGGVLGGGGP
ncbi:type II secretion system F family protein [Streptomyces phaeoluteigriseus]|uniref:type II secretion system F family protein n=1 Tax=Streptomyces phaeoluteigriseus TaxID=114686 RepID=UPI003673A314